MSDTVYKTDDEIDLKELLSALWYHKILIGIVTGFSIFVAGYYLLTIKKKFTSTAVFQIEQADNSGFNFSGELGALASIAGFSSSGVSEMDTLLERIVAREFILEISQKFSLKTDPFFNSYDPNKIDPFWKATIKSFLSLEPTKVEKNATNAIIENSIISNYKKFVKVDNTLGGAMSISVTHTDPVLSARYANNFMEEIRKLVEFESDQEQTVRLSYLSRTLADALQEVEATQQKLKDYAMRNSALAQENFISGSLKLDEHRMESRRVKEIAKILSIIENLIKNGNFDDTSHETLRATYPLVDDVDFRRILGMSETISAWSWPKIDTIKAVSATLKDRIKRLDIEITNIEDDARIYASSAGDLVKLTRDAKIAEATYTVLIEQVKSQSLAAGFQPNTFKVFQYAVPPMKASKPNKKIIFSISAVFGFLVACALAMVNSLRTGVYYSKANIISDSRATLILRSRSFRKLTRWSFIKIKSYLSKHRVLEIDEAEIKLANRKLIYVVNCGGRPTASGTARLLATQSSTSGRKVVLCDKTGQTENELEGELLQEINGLPLVRLGDKISFLKGQNEASFFTSSSFNSTIEKLLATNDQVFICSHNYEASLGLMALKNFDPSIVLLARLRKTRKSEIKKIRKSQTIDILFYD